MDVSAWIEHRRADGELVGWMRPEGDGFVPVDLLGRDRAGVLDWLAAEELLDGLGIGYLADAYVLERPGRAPLRVRILEMSTDRIRVKRDDFGAIDVPLESHELAWPMPAELRPLEPGEHTGEWPFAAEA
ncbi:hypothetical protein H4J02_05370 [Protaetiibacter sp. SSC-01]|uniref:hypothetical protein n=1 Tax=Protaetiibacter sp. SSC-01 TaxID=2759943 RepID=UPI0016571659|nr:hypothetical protein [Protaetiibacter sp. SSC-01]QNO38436.1 hypothetical protein H4J02_05370 [Protaetiibacter sp. SSC-01]